MKRKDLINCRFGKLIVKSMIYGVLTGSRKRTYCECICDCGNTITPSMDSLVSGRKISCGCDTVERRKNSLRNDLSGMQLGRLTVLEMCWDKKPAKATCRCECGRTTTVIGTQLTSGKTQSCGCLQAERASESNTKDWTSIVSSYGISFIEKEKMNAAGKWLWRCRCGLCGNQFVALPAKVMNGHITSCGCRRQSSREQLIRNELRRAGVLFAEQYSFSDCCDKQALLFDFAIFCNGKIDCLIEYDGRQHFEPIQFFGGKKDFLSSVRRDNIKNEYCKKNKIKLFRLPYTLSDKEILEKVRDIIIRRDCNTFVSNNEGFAVLPNAG